jgi:hypothetical protein
VVTRPRTRRDALAATGAALAGTAGLAVSGCGGPKHPHPKSVANVASPDVKLLLGLLAAEQKTIAAYEAGIPLLSKPAAKDAGQFLGQEESHAGELIGLLKKANVPAPTPGVYNLGHPRTERQVLELLERLENAQLDIYLSTIPKLSAGPLRAAAAAIFANDAQHVMYLRVRLHKPPAPAAFVVARQ